MWRENKSVMSSKSVPKPETDQAEKFTTKEAVKHWVVQKNDTPLN